MSNKGESDDTARLLSRRRFLRLSAAGFSAAMGLGVYGYFERWKYIVIHHSAGSFGNVAFLGKIHRERQPRDPVDSMAYHFVIGNGNGMEMGAVAHGLRWRTKLWGSHVSARNTFHNLQGIGICLIGNFHRHGMHEIQYRSLVTLVRTMMTRYEIPPAHVMLHGRIKGEQTVCPGKLFPYKRLADDISA